jgi:choline dehydrogenase
VSALPVNCVDGRRISTALAYLEPARGRPNLTIGADSTVADLVVRNGRAGGVRLDGGETVGADEVIVCAGAYASPGLLLRSGIGPADDVAALGLPVVSDLPGVGANLVDHPWVSIDLPCAPPTGDPALFQLAATVRSSVAHPAGAPDLQLMVCGPYPMGDGYGCSFAAALLRPASRGRIRLHTLDPVAVPDIDLGYFGHGDDLDRLTECLRLADAVTQNGPLPAATNGSRFGPDREVIADDHDARAWVRASAATYHHPVGTCAMGLDPRSGAVVDPDGHVYGVAGLSVVDASILPDVPSANTNIPTIMLAEHLAARRVVHTEAAVAGVRTASMT